MGSTFDTERWAPAKDADNGLLCAHDVPNGGRVVITPAGPTLWVPGKASYDYRKIFRLYLAQYGFKGELGKLDVDHVISRGAYYRRQQARYPRQPRAEWFLVMAARTRRNRHWGHWEGRARTTGMLGFMEILKSLDKRSPGARDRIDGFSAYAHEMAQAITPLLGWKTHAVLPSSFAPGTPDAIAAKALGVDPGELIDTQQWVVWAIMSEAIETRGLP